MNTTHSPSNGSKHAWRTRLTAGLAAAAMLFTGIGLTSTANALPADNTGTVKPAAATSKGSVHLLANHVKGSAADRDDVVSVTDTPLRDTNADKDGIQRSITRADGSVRVETIANEEMAGCQVYYPEGANIKLATLEKDADCWDSSMLSRKNYRQLGWNRSQSATSAESNVTMVKGGLTVYAVWQRIGYNITYDKNADDATGEMGKQPVSAGDSVNLTPNAFKRTGYMWTGWKSQPAAGDSFTDGQLVTPTGDMTLYAQWTPVKGFLDFTPSNCVTSSSQLSVTYGQDYTLTAPTAIKNGFKFTYWSTNPDGTGTRYTAGQTIRNVITADGGTLTLYAQCSANAAALHYDPNGGTGSMDDTPGNTGQTVNVAPNKFTRKGYTFTGWADTAAGDVAYHENDGIQLPAGGKTIYAKWTANSYIVSYDPNKGDGHMEDQKFQYDVAQSLTANTFTRTGYTFTGWNTKPGNDGKPYADQQNVVNLTDQNGGKITLYAQWQANGTELRYHGNGGTGTMANQSGKTDQQVTVKDNGFTRTGYTFTGWNTSAKNDGKPYKTGDQYTLTDQGGDLYAQWTADPAKIVYKPNNSKATGSTPDTDGVTDQTVKLEKNGFTLPGYQFLGWNTTPKGDGTTYQPDADFKLPAGTTTLYAQWKADGALLHYDGNGADGGNTPDQPGVTGQTVNVSQNGFTRTGYTFTGWNTTPKGDGKPYKATDQYTLTPGTTTLYAQWKADPSTLTYDPNGGDGETKPNEGVTGQHVTVSENGFKKPGFTFTGWNTQPDGKGDNWKPGDDYELPLGGGTLYAQWTPDPARIHFDANGGKGSMDDMTGFTGDDVTLSKNRFTNGCAVFKGWNTLQDGSGVSYKDENAWTMVGDVTLYAMWDHGPCAPVKELAKPPLAQTGLRAGGLLAVLVVLAAAGVAIVSARRRGRDRR